MIRPITLSALKRRASDMVARPRWPETTYRDAEEGRAILDLIVVYERVAALGRQAPPPPSTLKPFANHNQDSDCTVDADGNCDGCGVWHGAPCPECRGTGYHKPGCVESDATGTAIPAYNPAAESAAERQGGGG